LSFEPKGRGEASAGLVEGLKYLTKITKKTSVSFLLSDFFVGEEDVAGVKRALSIARQRHDMIPIMTIDPLDERFPDIGHVAAEDPETGNVIWIDTSSRGVRRRFEQEAFAQRARMEAMFKTLSLDYLKVWTDRDDYIPQFNLLFQRRAKRF
jgi:hypothetical protein